MTDLTEIMKSATAEQIQKAGACKNAEEFLTVAKAEGIDLTAEQAQTIVKMSNPPQGELSDIDLDNIAGGYGDKKPPTMECPKCHGKNAQVQALAKAIYCPDCGYFSRETGNGSF